MPEQDPTMERLRQELADLSARIGQAKRAGEDASDLIARHRELSAQVKAAAAAEAEEQPQAVSREWAAHWVHSAEEFQALEDDWRTLASEADGASIFHTYDWLAAWWEAFGAGCELEILVVRDDRAGVTGAIVPLMRSEGVLRFIGTGEGARSDYLSPVVRREEAEVLNQVVSESLLEPLARTPAMLEGVRIGAPWLRALTEAWLDTKQGDVIFRQPRLGVWGEIAETPADQASNIATWRMRKRFREAVEGGLNDWSWEPVSDPQEATETLEWMRARSTENFGGASSWADPRHCRFMASICARGVPHRWALLRRLRTASGSAAAALLGFVHGAEYYWFQPVIDRRHEDLEPGHALMIYQMLECATEGITRFDLLPADHRYKREWFDGRALLANAITIPKTRRAWLTVGRQMLRHALRGKVRQAKMALSRRPRGAEPDR